MSTLATADLGPSDDEGDTDFVLPAPKAKRSKKRGAHGVKRVRSGSQSASDGESSGSSDQDGDDDADDDGDDEVKRLRAEHAEAQAEERKRRAADAFKAMQEEARAPVKAAGEVKAAAAEVEMVEVKRPRRFAGETIYETVRVPKDDPEAVKYLAHVAAEGTKPTATPAAPANGDGTGVTATPNADSTAVSASSSAAVTPAPPLASIAETPTSSAAAAAVPPPAASGPPPPPRRGPPMRKRPRQSLEAMAAAIDKGKKMTTLEKSQMDWDSHMATETKLADEVAQHRKTGGFLEKQAFLERVGERRAMPPGAGSGSSRRG